MYILHSCCFWLDLSQLDYHGRFWKENQSEELVAFTTLSIIDLRILSIWSIMLSLHFSSFYASFTTLLGWYQIKTPLSVVLCFIAQAWGKGPRYTLFYFFCISYISLAVKVDVRWVTLLHVIKVIMDISIFEQQNKFENGFTYSDVIQLVLIVTWKVLFVQLMFYQIFLNLLSCHVLLIRQHNEWSVRVLSSSLLC